MWLIQNVSGKLNHIDKPLCTHMGDMRMYGVRLYTNEQTNKTSPTIPNNPPPHSTHILRILGGAILSTCTVRTRARTVTSRSMCVVHADVVHENTIQRIAPQAH